MRNKSDIEIIEQVAEHVLDFVDRLSDTYEFDDQRYHHFMNVIIQKLEKVKRDLGLTGSFNEDDGFIPDEEPDETNGDQDIV
jgi:hypothetical protein